VVERVARPVPEGVAQIGDQVSAGHAGTSLCTVL
jgi:hypothetical protein